MIGSLLFKHLLSFALQMNNSKMFSQRNLKKNKTNGFDDINSNVITSCYHELISPLFTFVNSL